jgi:hypothetical protein
MERVLGMRHRTAEAVASGNVRGLPRLPVVPIGSKAWNPVILPPGRARLATNPLSTGSPTWMNTIGIVLVSR